jgi:hypothetical protein
MLCNGNTQAVRLAIEVQVTLEANPWIKSMNCTRIKSDARRLESDQNKYLPDPD